jgi:hypothetical protein
MMKKKCIVMLSGGFGNQLHQLANGLCFSKEMETELFVDTSYYQKKILNSDTKRNYDLDYLVNKPAEKNLIFTNSVILYLVKNVNFIKFIFEAVLKIQFLFDSTSPINKKCNTFIFVYVSGNLQLYENHYSSLVELFSIKNKITTKAKLYLNDYVRFETVVVHIRRTDYLNSNSIHHVLDLDYFLNGIEIIKNNISNTFFLFISDDIKWVKDNFDFNDNSNFKIVESNDPFFDFSLLKIAKHVIISNSTFSWWGAFLNENLNKKVVAPIKWLKVDNDNIDDRYDVKWYKL